MANDEDIESNEDSEIEREGNDKKVYEMLWDCSNCGTKKLLGKTQPFCPSCGGKQDPTTRYFPPEEEQVAVEDHDYVGADKVCPYCKSANAAKATFCTQCGGPMDGSKSADLVQDPTDVAHNATQQKNPKESDASGNTKKIVIGALAAVAVFVGVCVFWKSTTQLKLTRLTWEKTVPVERYKSVSKNQWCSSMPIDAYNIFRTREKNGTKKIADGETCRKVKKDRGNGTFRYVEKCRTKYREEATYANKCRYMVDRWALQRTAKASGGLTDTIKWPVVNYHKCAFKRKGCEKTGVKKESYYAHFVNPKKNKIYKCDLKAEAKWRSYTEGDFYKAKIGVISNSINCDSIKKSEK